MEMNTTIAWWANLVVLVIAAAVDLRKRRIPNWLTAPFLVSGVAFQSIAGGWHGFGQSLTGIGLALLLFAPPCFFRGMGLGDLKLAVGVAAWIGPGQALIAFIMTAIVGGGIAVCYALRCRSLNRCLENAGELMFGPAKHGRRSGGVAPYKATALSIPYAPAIAIGTLFSFFAR